MNNSGKHLLIISGPSGCGKDSIVKEMLKNCPWLGLSVSATTRPPRPGEVDGVDYYFLKKEEFETLIEEGQLLEHTNYIGNYYGTLKSEVDSRISQGKAVVLVVEVQGAANIKAVYPNATTIFVVAPSMAELARRLRGRGTESRDKVRQRLCRAKEEMTLAPTYDYTIVNDDLKCSAEAVEKIFTENRNRE